eukprot:122282_1
MTALNLLLLCWITHMNTNSAVHIVCNTETTEPTSAPSKEVHEATPQPTLPHPGFGKLSEPPTNAPIILQTVTPCSLTGNLDTIILNDVSYPMTEDDCEYQQSQLSTVIRSIKSEQDTTDSTYAHVRIGYIEFDSTDSPQIVISLEDAAYNKLPVRESDMDALDTTIISSANCAEAEDRSGTPPNLQDAIKVALDHFGNQDLRLADKKIMIFSHSKADNIGPICADNDIQEALRAIHTNGVDIVMINIGSQFTHDDLYITCLTEYDADRMYNVDSALSVEDVLSIRNNVCSAPTPIPTTDPTTDPTASNARRLLLDIEHTYDITSGFDGSPCIEMNIKLETENLLPLNSDPDPVSNIVVIAKAIANRTLGRVTIPDTYDPDDNDTIPYTNVVWDIDHDGSCAGEEQQMEREYMPTVKQNITLDFDIIDEGSDGFTATAELQTQESIMYLTHVEYIPFIMTHDCPHDLVVQGAIYDNENALVAITESISMSKNDDPLHEFYFESTVKLLPGTLYQIHFELVNDYPKHCDFNNLQFSTSRRRMADDDDELPVIHTANGCYLGLSLAKSEAMRAGAAAMCNDGLGYSIKNEIEEGLFRQHISQSAMHNHLFKTGSLHLFNASGYETLNISDFPGDDVQSPCIAVDEEHNIIFAIGGHIDGTATNTIQAYQFTDSSLSNGSVLDVGDWALNEARYGSICFYWQSAGIGKIVVISGMATAAEEFTTKSKWFKDVRLLTIPEYIFDQSLPIPGFVAPSFPIVGEYTNAWARIDSKPMLYQNHLLYLWGGKTHWMSKKDVGLMDLNDISDDATDNSLIVVQRMTLGEHRALPLTDLVEYNDSNCYMILDGQEYRRKAAVFTNDTLLQLFCNENIESDDRRRRLGGNTSPRLTAFDMEMIEKGKAQRRRLQTDESEVNTGEVLMSKYRDSLDGVWYNFSVNFELCYADNDRLREAETEYSKIVDGKPNDFAWLHWRETIADQILRVSKEVYKYWSNGFGAVKVSDLNIVDVRYEETPSPTPKVKLSHPQRRKARRWRSDYDWNEEDFIWIDDTFDTGDSDQDIELR